MSRSRGFKYLTECVNPEYHNDWGGPTTVKDAIDYCVYTIEQRAWQKISHYGSVNLLLSCRCKINVVIYNYIHASLAQKFTGTNITLLIGDEKRCNRDMVVRFVPMTIKKEKNTVPVAWCDDLSNWTWKNVIDYGSLSTSSTSSTADVWPPLEYKIQVQHEAIRNFLKSKTKVEHM